MKKKNMVMMATTLIVSSLLTVGCSQPKTSAERNAKHFVYASNDDFDPNFRTQIYDSITLSVPLFEQFWQMGKKDKESGVTPEEAQERVLYLKSDEFLNSIQRTSHFAGKAYKNSKSVSPKWRKAMSEGISATYMDGYEGRD
ncbi:Exc2 family lipoprotein [Xenorhabdus innexi]|uniref:Putative Exc2 n=1 Tax=Xenorhabdus innexi TaxID=290109 RepID=A0A1N6MRF6_9GAMM|nr:Exc2 family lipoprotein [Xenorhabdus innexi]PHM33189.1 hypothetical protein Xinn_02718 [Xenorhabdus innexi]SIP71415.1 putative Exc2 [Xenorhabdus innexi]